MSKIVFTAGRVSAFICPADKAQAFMWDLTAPGLGLGATPAGKPSYVFQSEYQSKTVRLTIGGPDAWSIEQARARAKTLQRLIDDGKDPRDLKRDALAADATKAAADAAQVAADAAQALTVGAVWDIYLQARRTHWGERHYRDHETLSKAGGIPAKRGTRGRGLTIAGPLHSLVHLPLRDLTTPAIEAWATKEAMTRQTSARLAWRCLKAFLAWCSEQAEYAPLVSERNPAKSKKARESLGKAKVKQDALLKEQLTVWFSAVRQLHNPVIAAYLQTLLLTGARPGEVLALRWEDVNTKWRGLTIRDKVEGERVIPLTSYVSHLLAALPRRVRVFCRCWCHEQAPQTARDRLRSRRYRGPDLAWSAPFVQEPDRVA